MAGAGGSPEAEQPPSPWVVRFAPRVGTGLPVLDVACGRGRHTRLFLRRGNRVVAVDRDLSGIGDLRDDPRLEALEVDLEGGRPFALARRRFAAVIVVNYLHRPILKDLMAAVAPCGVLIYETFAAGNERYGRPSRPEFLLAPGELLEAVRGQLRVVAFEDLVVDVPSPAAVQRIVAVRALP
jgi:SAM-dependent methyltransferase